MKAAIFDAPFRMHVGSWEQPAPGPHEVVVAVKAAGICAGDMHIYSGKSPYAEFPIIGGHEICGTVERIGEQVSNFAAGQLVVEPFLSCGACYPCRIGKSNCCTRLQIIGVHPLFVAHDHPALRLVGEELGVKVTIAGPNSVDTVTKDNVDLFIKP
jgi:L-gulonate 5-dehydrogenase